MKLIVRDEAAADLDHILDWIAQDNPRAAVAMVRRIRKKIDNLLVPELVQMGRSGRDKGTRELIEPPYVIVYEVHDDVGEVVVLAILHGARDRDRLARER